jgi:nucleotide-binding universal stress UspA family protein
MTPLWKECTIFNRIFVPLDRSSRAERALLVAARIARAEVGSLTLYRALSRSLRVGLLSGHVSVREWLLEEELAVARATHQMTEAVKESDSPRSRTSAASIAPSLAGGALVESFFLTFLPLLLTSLLLPCVAWQENRKK